MERFCGEGCFTLPRKNRRYHPAFFATYPRWDESAADPHGDGCGFKPVLQRPVDTARVFGNLSPRVSKNSVLQKR
jgi:hypothetical protein